MNDGSGLEQLLAPGALHPLFQPIFDIRRLARTCEARAVAEGVELESDLRLVAELGVDLAQGYFLATPLAAAELVARGLLGPWVGATPSPQP